MTTVPGQPSVTVGSTMATSISLSWSVSMGSVVESYVVMWERDISAGECNDEDLNTTTITGSSTSQTIMELEENSTYTITVTASNGAGDVVSDSVSGVTAEASEYLDSLQLSQKKYECSFHIL